MIYINFYFIFYFVLIILLIYIYIYIYNSYLSAALNTPAMKRPGNPGNSPKTFMTNNGNS